MRAGLVALLLLTCAAARAADGVFVRFQLREPDAAWFVKLGGYIHNDPWYLPNAVWPEKADKLATNRIAAGEWSPWFDLGTHAGKRMHGRLNRAGGIAEFPNVTAQFVAGTNTAKKHVMIELATAPDESAVVKRFDEKFSGDLTSFLVSPTLRADAKSLETAAQMTARRLEWAKEVSDGKRVSPTNLWIQTGFWGPQRGELMVKEAEVLWLLGFNVVGNQTPDTRAAFPFAEPGGHNWVEFAPWLSRADIAKQITAPARKAKAADRPSLFNFSDEIVCRPGIGSNHVALANFRGWLKARGLAASDFGVVSLDEVVPIESPQVLRERQKTNRAAANRTFYWTSRFRQASATERLKWLTESFHEHAPTNVLTSTLVADHPYFGGSGLGMGMEHENTTWGGFPLSLDWFDLARERAVDVMGIEDWLGLNFMYGPGYTWEGFQLIGFQAAMFRSGSRGELPVITWITPSDEQNLRLKSASALCQGAKHFFYWTYGPTATSTENYWSDLRGAYDGVVAVTRQLAAAEHIIAPGRPRSTRVALLYSLSSDLWQPFGYAAMAERRLTYFSLIHDQYLVDFLTERDVEEGRLRDYAALYVVDPNISTAACAGIRAWVRDGGSLYGAAGAASRNEFDEEHDGLSDVFGIAPKPTVEIQPGRFDVRGGLNDLAWLDRVGEGMNGFGALAAKARIASSTGGVTHRFADGSPAVVTNSFGRGSARYVATYPGHSYAKDARFVAAELKEKWPAMQRDLINTTARGSGASRLVELSHPVVEAGVFDAPTGTALVLANFTYERIRKLSIRLPAKEIPKRVRSAERGSLKFKTEPAPANLVAQGFPHVVTCTLDLGLNDILVFE